MSYVCKVVKKDNPNKFGYIGHAFRINKCADDEDNLLFPTAGSAVNYDSIDLLEFRSCFRFESEMVERRCKSVVYMARENFLEDGYVRSEFFSARGGTDENLFKAIKAVIDAGCDVVVNEKAGESTLNLYRDTTEKRMSEFTRMIESKGE